MCPTAFEPSFEEWKLRKQRETTTGNSTFEPSFEEWKPLDEADDWVDERNF